MKLPALDASDLLMRGSDGLACKYDDLGDSFAPSWDEFVRWSHKRKLFPNTVPIGMRKAQF